MAEMGKKDTKVSSIGDESSFHPKVHKTHYYHKMFANILLLWSMNSPFE